MLVHLVLISFPAHFLQFKVSYNTQKDKWSLLQPTLRQEGEAKSQKSVFQKGKHVGVTTNVYSRKTLEKTKKRSANFENKVSGVVYAWERY
ncbi:hypothetical protein GmHk_08G023581 [Glycine max]|nr:hypothetical protein GmHk_08G023581 [Glycine max]